MKVARIAVAIAVAMTLPSAFAASAGDTTDKDQAPGASAAKWYDAGSFERQSEQGKAQLDRQGFPQYVQ